MNTLFTPFRILALTFFVACVLVAVQAQVSRQPSSFKFPASDSEYTVLFPAKPTIREVHTADVEGAQAELILPSEGGFLRAEFVKLSAEQARSLVNLTSEAEKSLKEERIKLALKYAESIGLSNAAVQVEDDNRGWCASVRGYKEIDGIPVTYETKFFYGRRSVISLTTGASSRRFPTLSVSKFYSSLKQQL